MANTKALNLKVDGRFTSVTARIEDWERHYSVSMLVGGRPTMIGEVAPVRTPQNGRRFQARDTKGGLHPVRHSLSECMADLAGAYPGNTK